jgi:outer membrane cobalamin receptor
MQRQCFVWLTSLAVGLILALSGPTQAAVSGKIVGTVTDAQTGESLPGVNVVVEGLRLGAVTDVNGRYFILNVPAGRHNVQASLIGYAPVVAQEVSVRIDLTTTQNFTLDQEAIEIGELTVIAERPLVQQDVTTSRTLISRDDLAQKPISSIAEAVAQSAGAVVTNMGTFIRGGRSGTGEVVYYVDGVSLSDAMGGNELATTIPRFAVENMEVMRGSYSAEYGNAQSAVITVVTPEGGTVRSGSFYVKVSDDVIGLADSQSDLLEQQMADLAKWRTALETGDFAAQGIDTSVTKAPLANTAAGVDMQAYGWKETEFNIGGPNRFAASMFPLGLFNTGTYFVSGRYFERDGRWRGQSAEDWALRGKLTFRNASGDKKLSITMHRQEGTADGSGFFVSGDDGETAEDYNYYVTTGDTIWLGPDGRLWWVPSPDPAAQWVVVDALEGPNGERVAVENYNMRPNWAGYYNDASSELSATYTHTISPKTYYTLRLSRFAQSDDLGDLDPWYLYTENRQVELDKRTQIQDRFWRNSIPSLASRHFQISPNAIGGDYVRRSQTIWTARFDIESQFTATHSGKRGFEYKHYDLYRVRSSPVSGGQVYHDDFDVNPYSFAAYFAEKFETQGMILNIGARIDYLATNGVVPGDLDQPVNIENQKDASDLGQYSKLPGWLRDPQPSDAQWFWSPRIGVSYPISATAKMRFSYGHFYQFPDLYRYYMNMERNMDGGWKYAGNPNLGPEKTILYEVGYEQQFARMFYTSLTGFYKDIDGLIDMEEYGTSVSSRYKYYMYVNSGYGNVRGFEIMLQNQRYMGFQFNSAYTFSIARGRGGNTRQGFLIIFNNQAPRTEDYPLEWDQTHTLQLTLDYRTPSEWGYLTGGWGANAQYTYNSGIPYSSSSRGISPPINDKRYPSNYGVDLLVSKDIALARGSNLQIFMEVLNLTDRRSVIQIQDPERLEHSKREIALGTDIDGDGYVSNVTVADYLAGVKPEPMYGGRFNDPTTWSAGRRVRFGTQFSF